MVLAPETNHSDKRRWICIYPAFINSNKALAQGRRIAKDKAVADPNYEEIRDVLSAAGLQVGVENKLYSRENSKELLYCGRIRVQLFQDNGSPCNPKFPTRDSLLLYLGENIPKLKSRLNKPADDRAGQGASAAPLAERSRVGGARANGEHGQRLPRLSS